MNGGHKNSEDDYYDYMDMFDEEDYYNYGAGINWIISQRTDAPQGSILVYLINLYRNFCVYLNLGNLVRMSGIWFFFGGGGGVA